MNPVGTLGSCAHNNQQLAAGSVNGHVAGLASSQCSESSDIGLGKRMRYASQNKLFGLKEQEEEDRYVKMS